MSKLREAHGARFIDPQDCGSSVRWIIDCEGHESGVWLSASVSLTDCDRRISWDFSGNARLTERLAKIDGAIAELCAFRNELLKAHREAAAYVPPPRAEKPEEAPKPARSFDL